MSLPKFGLILSGLIIISCSAVDNNPYYTIEDANQNPKKVRQLYIVGQNLKVFPADIRSYENLEELNLSLCNLTEIPNWIGELKKLKRLDLLNNTIQKIPIEFYELENLEEVVLLGNKIGHLDSEIGKLIKLRELNLASTNLTELPISFKKLDNLEVLFLYRNNFNSIPEAIFDLEKIQRLDIYDNPISSIPSKIGQIETLHHLDFSNTKLKTAQVDSVKRILPFCKIYFENDSIPDLENLLKEKQKKDTVKLTATNKSYKPLSF